MARRATVPAGETVGSVGAVGAAPVLSRDVVVAAVRDLALAERLLLRCELSTRRPFSPERRDMAVVLAPMGIRNA